MEELIISPVKQHQNLNQSSDKAFIKSNTEAVSINHLMSDCIVPSYAKDNEVTISHLDFIETAAEVVAHYFKGEDIQLPAIRASHEIKGRIPEAIRKPVNELQDFEKTLYYERLAFIIEIPTITYKIGENNLALTIGGVRSYNLENLHGKKTEEKFKVFIGFQNKVCLNLCISTDGFKSELKARTLNELGEGIYDLIKSFNLERQLMILESMPTYNITEHQFATLIGKLRMYQFMSNELKQGIPNIMISDSQINQVVKEYYMDKNFNRNEDGSINLWSLYNLFTEANKSSYIDSFLNRSVNATDLILHLMKALKEEEYSWYLN
jgi:hypothetical protein